MKKLIALGLALLIAMTMLCSCGKEGASGDGDINEKKHTDSTEAPEAAGVKIDEEHFPDNTFRGYILKEHDINGDRYLDEEEISVITKIGCAGEYIKTLKGIEYFTSLEELYCGSNELTELDVSKCTQLRALHCDYNQLSTLDLSNCTQLSYLDCSLNQLTSLNISGCTLLERLECRDNQLTSLDMSGRSSLEYMECSYNQLTSLDLSGCTSLGCLYCYGNELTSLDVSDCREYIEVGVDEGVTIIK